MVGRPRHFPLLGPKSPWAGGVFLGMGFLAKNGQNGPAADLYRGRGPRTYLDPRFPVPELSKFRAWSVGQGAAQAACSTDPAWVRIRAGPECCFWPFFLRFFSPNLRRPAHLAVLRLPQPAAACCCGRTIFRPGATFFGAILAPEGLLRSRRCGQPMLFGAASPL